MKLWLKCKWVIPKSTVQPQKALGLAKLIACLASLAVIVAAQPASACDGNTEHHHNIRALTSLIAKERPFKFQHNGDWRWSYVVPLPGGFIDSEGSYHRRLAFEYHANNHHFLLPGDTLATTDMDQVNSLLDFGRAACEQLGLKLAGQSIEGPDNRTKRYSYWYMEEIGLVMHDRRTHALSSALGETPIPIKSDVSDLNITGAICK